MEEFWENKIDEVVEISKGMGYKELNKEFWMNKPAILISLVIDIQKSKKKALKIVENRLEAILKEDKGEQRR